MKNRISTVLLSLTILGLFAASGAAQTITGQVKTAAGVGLAGVNIDGFDSSGNALTLSNDGTDPSGNFTTTVDDGPGVYTFVFYPPAPPAITHLVAESTNVVVVTTTNLGVITLGAGVLLSGRAVQTGSVPVSNVTLTVIDGPTGTPVLQNQDKTNAFGTFNLAVPAHSIELQLDPSSSAFVLGARALTLSPTGTTALGDVNLPPGALVTAHVQRTNGTPVGGADFDFQKTTHVHSAFTPGDNTNSAGDLALVVPTGTYFIEICPKVSDALPAKALVNVAINTTTNLGTITIPNGVKLFGTVVDAHGLPASQVDVDAFNSFTGVEVPLCRDDTDAAGAYSVYVPSGTYDVLFLRNGAGAPIGGDLHTSVVVSAETQLNGTLPAHSYGNSFGGTVGIGAAMPPVSGKTRGAGTHAPGGSTSLPTVVVTSDATGLELGGAVAGAPAWLLFGASPAELTLERARAPGGLLSFLPSGSAAARVPLAALGGARVFVRSLSLDARHHLVLGPIQAFVR